MYNNPYYNPYNIQSSIDNINNQIANLERYKAQMSQNNGQIQPNTQPTSINQTFQLAPTNSSTMKYVNTIDDVNKELVVGDTPFFSKDMSTMWVKNTKAEVKVYELHEVVQKDEKDLIIENLQKQINELKEMNSYEQCNEQYDEPIIEESLPTTRKSKSSNVSITRSSKAK